MSDERLLTVKQVAEQFGVRKETVLRWIKTGRIRGVMVGGTKVGYRIAASEVDRVVRGE
jgi:excisionase family DNA binding protein